MLFQDLALCDDLDVADNFYLGREPTRFGLVRYRWMHAQTRNQLEALDVRLPSTESLFTFSREGSDGRCYRPGGLVLAPGVILDEPTAALGVRQARRRSR
jgi:D-xylose transport system ATP-binding protein